MKNAPDLKMVAMKATQNLSDQQILERLPRPVIILSPPRSGSTLLFEQMTKQNHCWTIGGESHLVFREFNHLRAKNVAQDSMALGAEHADPETRDLFRRIFLVLLRNNKGRPLLRLSPDQIPKTAFMLEKTPRNALNIPFLNTIFPDAHYIYLQRDARQTISSLIEAWTLGLETGRFVTFPNLPDWPLPGWCFLLPEGWRDMRGKSLTEIATFQWQASHHAIIEGLTDLPQSRWISVNYSNLVNEPRKTLSTLLSALDVINTDLNNFVDTMRLSRSTVSAPSPDKWKRHKNEIDPLLPILAETQLQIDAFCKRG